MTVFIEELETFSNFLGSLVWSLRLVDHGLLSGIKVIEDGYQDEIFYIFCLPENREKRNCIYLFV